MTRHSVVVALDSFASATGIRTCSMADSCSLVLVGDVSSTSEGSLGPSGLRYPGILIGSVSLEHAAGREFIFISEYDSATVLEAHILNLDQRFSSYAVCTSIDGRISEEDYRYVLSKLQPTLLGEPSIFVRSGQTDRRLLSESSETDRRDLLLGDYLTLLFAMGFVT